VGSLALWPAGAGAAPIDEASGHTALVAYHGYVEGLLSRVPTMRNAIDKYVSSIAAACPGVLAPVFSLPSGTANQDAALAFIEELGLDLAVVGNRTFRPQLAKFAATLASLRWSTSQTGDTVQQFVTAQRRLFRLAPSHLCADMQAFASSDAQQTAPGAMRWLAEVATALTAQQREFASFSKVLRHFASPADAGLVSDTDHTFTRFKAAVKSALTPEATRLLRVLANTG
jgi:hypothetical protein